MTEDGPVGTVRPKADQRVNNPTHQNPAVIEYATPQPPQSDGPSARRHVALAVIVSVTILSYVAALRSVLLDLVLIAVCFNVVAAFLTPVVMIFTRPGSIHWVAGSLFFLAMVAAFPVAVWVAELLR